jgi:hypothetical protein
MGDMVDVDDLCFISGLLYQPGCNVLIHYNILLYCTRLYYDKRGVDDLGLASGKFARCTASIYCIDFSYAWQSVLLVEASGQAPTAVPSSHTRLATWL